MIKQVIKNYSKGEFCSYQIIYENSNLQKSVPLEPSNTDYQAIQKWIADGNTVIDNGGNN
jgi:hypothetical protein